MEINKCNVPKRGIIFWQVSTHNHLFNHIVSIANDEFVCSACSEFGMFVPKKLKYWFYQNVKLK